MDESYQIRGDCREQAVSLFYIRFHHLMLGVNISVLPKREVMDGAKRFVTN